MRKWTDLLRQLCAVLLLVFAMGTAASAAAATYALAPTADTYVSAGSHAGWDFGAATQLKVQGRIRVSYFTFDLSALPGPVTQATLILSATRSAGDGGTVYRIPDASWVEGLGTGSAASSTGLRFLDVDTNDDGLLDATDGSLLVPDATRAVGGVGVVRKGKSRRVDVTAGFGDGPALYSLALAGTGSASAAYASREHATSARRPVLEVVVADGLPPTTTTTTTLVSSSSSTTTLPAASACLAGVGPLTTAAGTYTSRFSKGSLAAGARVDARAGVFLSSPSNLYPIILGGGAGACVAGGTVLGQYDRTLSWQAMHDLNNAGIILDSDLTVEGIRIDGTEDGIRPRSGFFTVRGAWLSYIRDDCVENDHLQSGLIEDSLFDGCYVGLSERPSPDSTSDGRGGLVTMRHSLVRLESMPGPRGGQPTDLGHGVLFKWDAKGSALALYDNIFVADDRHVGGVPGTLAGCANNVMVWLGSGAYPEPLPACFTVTRDRSVWDAAVAAWKASHPLAGGS